MSLSLLKRALGRPPLFVDYPATVVSGGADFAACGTTNSVQVGSPTYTNGLGAYTYAWTRVSGSEAVNISNSAVERPAFNAYACDGASEMATFEVEVTDTTTGKKAKDQVEALCIWTNLT